jgi:20S proteasome subunit alpha 6
MFKVDDFLGMAISGLTADARVLCKFMRNECLSYKMTFGANKPLKRLLEKVAESTQHQT